MKILFLNCANRKDCEKWSRLQSSGLHFVKQKFGAVCVAPVSIFTQ